MSDELDDRIRRVLGGLREAPVPPIPALRPAAERSRAPLGLIAAAAMLMALAGSLFFLPRRPSEEGLLAARIEALESRIARIEHEELRDLLGRELVLLRKELELARAQPLRP
jgi:hypothetical protein